MGFDQFYIANVTKKRNNLQLIAIYLQLFAGFSKKHCNRFKRYIAIVCYF